MGTEYGGIDNPVMDGYKSGLYGDSGGIRYNPALDDPYNMMGHGIYDVGNTTAPPYDSHPDMPPTIAGLFSSPPPKEGHALDYVPSNQEEEVPPPPTEPAPPPPAFDPEKETDVSSPFTSARPASLNTEQHHASMSTINNPVASTPSDTPAMTFPTE